MVASAQSDVPAEAAQPTDPSRRIVALDVVRGVAVLGILLINIDYWAFPARETPNPFSFGVHSAIDRWTYIILNLLFEGSMRGLFSILFGAGFVLLATRLVSNAAGAAGVYYRRTAWLIVFGILHAYLLVWPGDILYTYGVVGLFLFPLRKCRPRTLILLALLVEMIPLSLVVSEHVHRSHMRAAAMTATELRERGVDLTQEQEKSLEKWIGLTQEQDDTPESHRAIEEEIAYIRESNYFETVVTLAPITFEHQTTDLIRWNFLDAAVGMLLGMALMKLGVITGMRSRGFDLRFMILCYSIGLAVNVMELSIELGNHHGSMISVLPWYTYDVARLFIALGHMSFILLFLRSGRLLWLTRSLGAVGRMALTNYVMQSVLCGLLFYGFGFGLVGSFTRFECVYVVLGVWLVQLILSPLWLHWFRFGPLEWIWRSLSYMRPAPMRAQRNYK